MNVLTRRQNEVLNAIREYKTRVGFPPTTLELAGLIGVNSPNAVACHVNALKKKGFITVAPGAARGITVLGETAELDAIAIIRALLNESGNARDDALNWLKERGIAL